MTGDPTDGSVGGCLTASWWTSPASVRCAASGPGGRIAAANVAVNCREGRGGHTDVARPVGRGGPDCCGAGSPQASYRPWSARGGLVVDGASSWGMQIIGGDPVQVSDTLEVVLKPVYGPKGRSLLVNGDLAKLSIL